MAKLNSKGDNGEPCLVPFASGIGEDRAPKVRILAVGEEYMFSRKVIKLPVKPILCNTLNNHIRLTLSNAFSASSAIIAIFSPG